MPDITFNCPHCNQSLEVPESLVGSTIFCPACQKSITFEVDAAPPMVTAQPQLNLAIKCPPSPASNPPPPQVSKSAVGPIIFDCPRCHTELEADSDQVATKLDCPKCSAVLTVPRQSKKPSLQLKKQSWTRKCPQCAEEIQQDAAVCHFCGAYTHPGSQASFNRVACTSQQGSTGTSVVVKIAEKVFDLIKAGVVAVVVLVVVFIGVGVYHNSNNDKTREVILAGGGLWHIITGSTRTKQLPVEMESSRTKQLPVEMESFLGLDKDSLVQKHGQPEKIEPNAYLVDSFIYTFKKEGTKAKVYVVKNKVAWVWIFRNNAFFPEEMSSFLEKNREGATWNGPAASGHDGLISIWERSDGGRAESCGDNSRLGNALASVLDGCKFSLRMEAGWSKNTKHETVEDATKKIEEKVRQENPPPIGQSLAILKILFGKYEKVTSNDYGSNKIEDAFKYVDA